MQTLIESTEYIEPFPRRSPLKVTYRVWKTTDGFINGSAEVIDSPWINVSSRAKLTGENAIKESRSVKEWLCQDLYSLIYELEDELERLAACR
jgi:hypothetical protein